MSDTETATATATPQGSADAPLVSPLVDIARARARGREREGASQIESPEPTKEPEKPEKPEKEKPEAVDNDKKTVSIDEVSAKWAEVRGIEKKAARKLRDVEARETHLAERERVTAEKESNYENIRRQLKEDPARFVEENGVSVRALVEAIVSKQKTEASMTPEQREIAELKVKLSKLEKQPQPESEKLKREEPGEAESSTQAQAQTQLAESMMLHFIETLDETGDSDYPTLHLHYSSDTVAAAATKLLIDEYKRTGVKLDPEEVFERLESNAKRAKASKANVARQTYDERLEKLKRRGSSRPTESARASETEKPQSTAITNRVASTRVSAQEVKSRDRAAALAKLRG